MALLRRRIHRRFHRISPATRGHSAAPLIKPHAGHAKPLAPTETYYRIMCVVPLVGTGKRQDPMRPAYVPVHKAGDSYHSGIIAWALFARIVALIFNWWSLFTRMAIPNRHTEATTSRPLLLHGIGRQTKHGNQTTLTITSNHAQAGPVRQALESVSNLLQRLVSTAQQLTVDQRWRRLLRFIFRDWLTTRSPAPVLLPVTAISNCRI